MAVIKNDIGGNASVNGSTRCECLDCNFSKKTIIIKM